MADQKVSNERKKELEQLDPFQEKMLKAVAWTKDHKKQLIALISAVVVVIAVFSGIMVIFKNSERKASELAARISEQYAGIQDSKEGYLAVQSDFQTLFEEYANTSAGKMARITFAKICFDAGEYDKAYDLYKAAYDLFKDESGLKNLLLISLGNVCQERKEFDQAKSYYLKVKASDSELLKDEACFALAGIYKAENDMAKSREMYAKIANDYKDSIYRDIAESEVGLVE